MNFLVLDIFYDTSNTQATMKKLVILFLTLGYTSVSFAEIKTNQPETKITPSVIAAANTEIKLEGFFEYQAGFADQNHLTGLAASITDNKKHTAFYTEAAFSATIRQQMGEVIGGAKIVLLPTTKPKTSVGYNGSHIFLETDYGKVELGSPADAAAKMRIMGGKVTAGSTAWNKYIVFTSDYLKYNLVTPDFDSSDNFYMSSFTNRFDDMTEKTESARKVSYYTPKIEGFRFGISYIPDTSNTGGNRSLNNLSNNGPYIGISKSNTGIARVILPGNQLAVINQNVKDAFSAGLTYDKAISDDLAIQVSLTGEYGKPARNLKLVQMSSSTSTGPGKVIENYKLSDLKAYNLGAVLSYGGFSFGASYGSMGKSLTTPSYHKTGRDTNYYNGAVAYGQGPIKTSISYFKSSRYKNTVDSVSLGTEYLVTPGLLPYAEVACFQAKGKPVYYPEAPNKKTRGTVAILGAKIKF